MPIYEYRCERCRAHMTLLAQSHRDPAPACSRCGNPQVTRLLSRFAAPRSEEARLEALADPAGLGDVDERDPRSVARWMKRLGREAGDELGDGFEEEIDRAVEETSTEGENAPDDAPGALDE